MYINSGGKGFFRANFVPNICNVIKLLNLNQIDGSGYCMILQCVFLLKPTKKSIKFELEKPITSVKTYEFYRKNLLLQLGIKLRVK